MHMNTDILAIVAIIFLLAFLIESLVEAVLGTPFDKIPALVPWKWTLMYAALAVGVIGAHVYQFDLLVILSNYLGKPIQTTFFGVTLTGLAIGRGSNYLHDLVVKWFKPVVIPEAPTQ
jgi:hypothetical protein